MWKAFEEMEAIGWITPGHRPKMICVQTAGCAPIVKAFEEKKDTAEMWPNAHTVAAGLRVPKAYADFILLDIMRKSHGTAIAVTDDELMSGLKKMASNEGIFAAPEGGAALVAYEKLVESGFLSSDERVVVFNTGSGYKYIDAIAKYWGIDAFQAETKLPASRSLGGIIGPF
jgi:threonine synthase